MYHMAKGITWKGKSGGDDLSWERPNMGNGCSWDAVYLFGCTIDGNTTYSQTWGPVSNGTDHHPQIRITDKASNKNPCAAAGGKVNILRVRPHQGNYDDVNAALLGDQSKYEDITDKIGFDGVSGMFTDTYGGDDPNYERRDSKGNLSYKGCQNCIPNSDKNPKNSCDGSEWKT